MRVATWMPHSLRALCSTAAAPRTCQMSRPKRSGGNSQTAPRTSGRASATPVRSRSAACFAMSCWLPQVTRTSGAARFRSRGSALGSECGRVADTRSSGHRNWACKAASTTERMPDRGSCSNGASAALFGVGRIAVAKENASVEEETCRAVGCITRSCCARTPAALAMTAFGLATRRRRTIWSIAAHREKISTF